MVAGLGSGIVLAPSNAAVSNIALELLNLNCFQITDVCVLGENCDESVKFLNPRFRSKQYHVFKKEYDKLDRPKLEKVREFCSWLRLDPKRSSVSEIELLCPRVDDTRKGEENLRRAVSAAKVVLCTLNTAGSASLRSLVKNKNFATLFLDEASQCPEAHFYICEIV